MTKEEAKKELAALEPKAAKIWDEYHRLIEKKQAAINRAKAEYDAAFSLFEDEIQGLLITWVPLKRRQDKLQAFLE